MSKPTYHKDWKRIMKVFSNAEMVHDAMWGKLILKDTRDSVTGWFLCNLREFASDVILRPGVAVLSDVVLTSSPPSIEGVVVPSGFSHLNLMPGTYSAKECRFYTAYPVSEGDQITINRHCYRVEAVQEYLKGNDLLAYECHLMELPLYV